MTQQTYIIAEAGVNHNGRRELAGKLVAEAARAGADAIKFQTFKAADLVAGPVLNYEQVANHPQVLHNGLIQEFHHPKAGKLRAVGTPLRFSKARAAIRARAPELGEHTEEILESAGYSPEEIAKLREKEVIPD